jgi:heme-degrading monooxygenase HmoA
MFVRHVTIELRAGSLTRFARIIEAEVLPLLRKQDGFRDQVTMVAPDCTEAVVITFWDDEESEEAFNRARNPEVARRLLEVVDGSPRVERFEAITSTLHDLAGATGPRRVRDEKAWGVGLVDN